MAEIVCAECGIRFLPKRAAGRQPRFCSTKCYMTNYDRHPDDVRDQDKNRTCIVCAAPFAQQKRHQRFCSRKCYSRSWTLDREKHNSRQQKRRQQQPDWYAEKEPKYYHSYRARQTSTKPWKYLFNSRRHDAEKRNIVFSLTEEWAASRWNNCCEITGIVFRQNGKRGPHPFSPSIDRIDSTKGYTPDNARFILWGCNAIKGVGTDADMYEIAKAIAARAPI